MALSVIIWLVVHLEWQKKVLTTQNSSNKQRPLSATLSIFKTPEISTDLSVIIPLKQNELPYSQHEVAFFMTLPWLTSEEEKAYKKKGDLGKHPT